MIRATTRSLLAMIPAAILVLALPACSLFGEDDDASDDCIGPEYTDDEKSETTVVGADLVVYASPDVGDPNAIFFSLTEGALPPGVELRDDGTIVGVPSEAGTWTAVVEASVRCDDGVRHDTLPVTIEVLEDCPPIEAPETATFEGRVGVEANWQLPGEGGFGRLGYDVESGQLPPGTVQTLQPERSISGVPTEPGIYEVAITIWDRCPTGTQERMMVAIFEIDPAASGDLAPGVYSIAMQVTEGIRVETEVRFGDDLAPPYLLAAGESNWGAFSLYESPFSTLYHDLGGPAWGVIAVANGADMRSDAKAVLAHGSGGSALTHWDPDAGEFGFTQLLDLGDAVVDAWPYDNSGASGGLCRVNGSAGRVIFVEYAPDGTMVNPPQLGSGVLQDMIPRSACVGPDGTVLIACDGEPGRLFHHDRVDVAAAATVVGDLGDQPRRVRAAGGIFAVTSFGSNQVDIGTWRPGVAPTLASTAGVGAGPFGVDLLPLDGGNVAVACAGFDDDTVTVLVVAPTGTVISSSTDPLPASCESPGHVAWLQDGSGLLLVSCNATSNIAVVDSGLR